MKPTCYISTLFRFLLRKQSTTFKRMASSTTKSDHLVITSQQQRDNAIYSAQVTDISDLSPTVKSMLLRVNTTTSYEAGQWLDLMIPGLSKVGGFTMCTSPLQFDKTKILQLAVKFSEHPPTYWIHTQSKVGSEVSIRFGGDFVYNPKPDDPPRDVLLLGGGVGINPLYCIMNYISDLNKLKTPKQLNDGTQINTLLLYSSSSTAELLFKKEMEELEKNNENIKCRYFVTREKSTQEDIKEHRINKNDLEDAFKFIKKDMCVVYVCGPIPMIETMEKLLEDLGIKKNQIRVDRWW